MAQFLTPTKANMTAGEKRFYKLLELYLDDDYLVWFDIPTNSHIQRFPDFLIFNPNYGLWCIEVKDWSWKSYSEIKEGRVFINHNFKGSEKIKSHAYPMIQARECLLPIINKLEEDKHLLQTAPKYQGRLLCPWGFAAMMSQWKLEQIETLRDEHIGVFLAAFPLKQTFFKEEVEKFTQEAFIKKLHGILPYQFGKLTKEQTARVRAHIFPEFIIEQKSVFGDDDSTKPNDIVTIMDNRQESLARRMGDGHRVIHGVAGSGKTILLEHRAKALAEKSPNETILVICYNILLAKRLEQRLDNKNIKVMHFHDWCSSMIEQFDLEKPKGKFSKNFDPLAKPVCEAIESGVIPHGQYHAVLIDEGHDFKPEWLMAMSKMPHPDNEHLLLLYDDAQSIYGNQRGVDFSLASVGIKAPGRTRVLHTNYRNSLEILTVAERFILQFLEVAELKDDNIPLLSIESSGKQTGNLPVFQLYDNTQDEISGIIKQIKLWLKCGVALGDIAVLCMNKAFAKQLEDCTYEENILVNKVIERDEKINYQPNKDALTLCMIKSSKGSEFSHVILSGLGAPKYIDARLIYVGMTRAQNALFMTASSKNAFTDALTKGEYQL